MAGYDGRGAKFPLVIVRGADMAFTVTATDSNAAAIDLSAATIAGEVYTTTGTLVDTLTAAVSGAGSNIITLSFTDTETTALTSDSYTWTLWVTRGGDKRPWLAGPVRATTSTNGGAGTNGTALTATVDSNVAVSVSVAVVGSPDAADINITDVATLYTATNVEAALAEVKTIADGSPTHIADTTDAHDASAISLLDTGGNYTATDVEAALAELPSQYAPSTGSPNYEPLQLIDSQEVTGSAAQLTFASIPQTFGDLVFVCAITPHTSAINLTARFNGVGVNGDYTHQRLVASATTASATTNNAESFLRVGTVGAATNYVNTSTLEVIDYTNTVAYKSARSQFSAVLAATPTFEVGSYHNWWKFTSAITNVVFSLASTTGLPVGSKIWMYGRGVPIPLA